MPRGPTTGKELFEIRLRMLIAAECRRRKTGRGIVLNHVVSVVQRFANDMPKPAGYAWRITCTWILDRIADGQ